ncbi:hypothetical protein K402DRAFT_425313 [Aulographum hederae CBS 113979]|uniref:Uncharacterized protein n=1 Tax=Aulographum hederae CBS 113979 TaxID=1176131 RepID=A0A6G1GKW6_9PEZI|nr:hypothetical protein K402DRAFT_425313 [Aulographum hederae CBS 113979]
MFLATLTFDREYFLSPPLTATQKAAQKYILFNPFLNYICKSPGFRGERNCELYKVDISTVHYELKTTIYFNAADHRFLLNDKGWWREMKVFMPSACMVRVVLSIKLSDSFLSRGLARPDYEIYAATFIMRLHPQGPVLMKHVVEALRGRLVKNPSRSPVYEKAWERLSGDPHNQWELNNSLNRALEIKVFDATLFSLESVHPGRSLHLAV